MPNSKKKILVTGGAGFVGTNLINFLLDNFIEDTHGIHWLDIARFLGNHKSLKDYQN